MKDVINTVLPPREWTTYHHQYFMQYASHSSSEREGIEGLQKKLDEALLQMQAKTEGVCPVREYLFSSLFDEIIRQVLINSPERGLMLTRVRDERKMTIAAHHSLYQDSVAFGNKKQV